jgi:hypothetical protein
VFNCLQRFANDKIHGAKVANLVVLVNRQQTKADHSLVANFCAQTKSSGL